MNVERSFPRGGKEKLKTPASDKPAKRKQVEDLFGSAAARKTTKKAKDAKKKAETDEPEFELPSNTKVVDSLNYKLMSEGMLVLGSVREIHRYHMMINLPGRTSGRVPITAISLQYSEQLTTADNVPMLHDLFRVGQHLVTKVTAIAVDGFYNQVTLSLAPDQINSELNHSTVKEGIVLTGAMSSIEDHGYLIEFGIRNLRGFLKKEHTTAFKKAFKIEELTVGQLVRCLVLKAKNSVSSTSVELTADPAVVNKALIPPTCGINPHLVIPGMKFEVTTVVPLKNGAMIKWNDFDGFVHSDHFPDSSKPIETQFEDVEQISATALFSLPLVRTVYLSMQTPAPFDIVNMDPNLETNGVPNGCNITLGEVIESAEVLTSAHKGISLRLKKGTVRGFVHSSQMPKMGEDENPMLKYPVKSKVQCRVLKYDTMDRVFMCTMQKTKISDKVLVAADVKPGMLVNCEVLEIRKRDLLVEINKWRQIKARVSNVHLSDAQMSDINKRFTVGQQIRGRVLYTDLEKNVVHVTLKPSFVQSKKPILNSYDNIPRDVYYEGVVVCVQPKFLLVSFYNDVTGKLSLDDIPSDLKKNFTLGQNIHVRVAKANPHASKLQLTMVSKEDEVVVEFDVGREYSAVIEQVFNKEVKLKISLKDGDGFGSVPKSLVSIHKSLAQTLMKSLTPGDKVKATCLFSSDTKTIFTIDSELARTLKTGIDEDLKEYSLLPVLVKAVGKSGVFFNTISRKGSELVFSTQKCLANEPIEEMRNYFVENQGLLFRVENMSTNKDDQKDPFKAVGSTKLMDVCPYGPENGGAEYAQNYLKAYSQIQNKLKQIKSALATYEPGQMVNAKVENVEGGVAEIKLDGGTKGFISNYHSHGVSLKKGQEVHAVVIWVDVGAQCVQLSIRPDILKQINKDQTSCPKPKADSTQRGEVILVTEDVVIVILKGQCKGLIACAPLKVHINDLAPEHYQLGETIKFTFKSLDLAFPMCVKKKNLPQKGKKIKAHPGSLERKIQNLDDKKQVNKKKFIEVKEESDSDIEEIGVKRIKLADEVKVEREVRDAPDEDDDVVEVFANNEIKKGKAKKAEKKKGEPQTLNVESFVWDPNTLKDEEDESSSDESEDGEAPKKKLTVAERRAMARKEEEKLVEAEQKLMNEEQTPQSVDEFDRLIMASPDSSIVWVQYMAFHLQATEIERARAVARKAFKTISFREEQEKLNVWVALLNLENLYGTPEALEKTLQEAVQLNDASSVYSQMLKIFSDTNKIEEGNKLFETMLRKYRADKETWIQGGNFYFQTNQIESGRHLLQRALRSLDIKNHVDVICRFAHLENKFGSPERCHTLFEHILTSYPKRTDIWGSYVDLLVKAGNLDAARNLLERAIVQKLPVRKMKVLFKKYLEFAQQHGTEEEVDSVKAKAQSFVQSIASNLPVDDDSDNE